MSIASRLRKANPVGPSTMTPRGRAELRALVGPDMPETPNELATTSTRLHHKRVWLVPIAAATLVIGGVGTGIYAGLTTGTAFADTVTASVMPGEIAPVPVGASIIIDIPFPDNSGAPAGLHALQRVWLKVGDIVPTQWDWTDIPDDLTFRLSMVQDDIGYYRAENWPYDKVFQLQIIGPKSPWCQGGDQGYPDASLEEIMAMSRVSLCPYALAEASPDPYYDYLPVEDKVHVWSEGFVSERSSQSVTLAGVSQDPQAMVELMSQFDLGADGQWVALPDGYETWKSRLDTTFVNWARLGKLPPSPPDGPLPASETPNSAVYEFALDDEGRTLVVWVDDKGQCTSMTTTDGILDEFTKDTFIPMPGLVRNDDGMCTYTSG